MFIIYTIVLILCKTIEWLLLFSLFFNTYQFIKKEYQNSIVNSFFNNKVGA